jgi:isochorismate synthase EntC
VEEHSNIRSFNSSNFLKEGAFVRWRGKWTLFQGPFQALNFDKSQVYSVACMNFFATQPDLFKASMVVTMDTASWREHIKPERLSRSFQWKGVFKENYSKSFALVKAQISSGNWKKAVPIAFDRCDGTLHENEKKAILNRLAETPENLIPYGFWKDGNGMIGLTPEILFFRNGPFLETMALAGTEKKHAVESQLLKDDKNLKEHDFVVQEVFEKLSSFGEVEAEGPQILELPTLFHLLTKFKVTLKKAWNDLEQLRFFHPTSALGISPFKKWRELEILPEQKQRGLFGSPFLVQLGEEQSLALVALRQIQWNSNEIFIGAGGGVVQESQEELEWLEILAKIDSVKKLMGIS